MALEPFLVNPPVRRRSPRRSLIAFGLNPRRRRARRNPFTRKLKILKSGKIAAFYPARLPLTNPLKRKKRSRTKGRVPPQLRAFLFKKGTKSQGDSPMRHRRKSRKNPVVLGNPRRRRHSARRNPRRRHRRNPFVLGNPHRRRTRRSYRRNPAIISKLGLPPAKEVIFLGLGAFAGRVLVPNVLARVPFLSSNPIIRAVSRLGLVAIAGYAAKMVMKQNARMFTYGLLANQVPEVVNDVLSMTGAKLSDGNQELELYTGADPYQMRAAAPAPGLSLYTLSDGEDSIV